MNKKIAKVVLVFGSSAFDKQLYKRLAVLRHRKGYMRDSQIVREALDSFLPQIEVKP